MGNMSVEDIGTKILGTMHPGTCSSCSDSRRSQLCLSVFWHQLCANSYHRAEGMPKEDGMSVQKSLVSAALRCLKIWFKRTKYTQIRSYMSAPAPDRTAPVVLLQLLPSTPDLWHWMLTSVRTFSPAMMRGAHISWGGLCQPISSMKTCKSDLSQEMVFLGPVSMREQDTGSSFHHSDDRNVGRMHNYGQCPMQGEKH